MYTIEEVKNLKKRYILIDSENVQNRLFEIIGNSRKNDKIIIFYTVHHSGRLEDFLLNVTKIKNIEFVECISGDNALDLQLMGVLSYLLRKHPKRQYVIYSNDKGYTTAVEHWKEMGYDVQLTELESSSAKPAVFEFKPKPKRKKTTAGSYQRQSKTAVRTRIKKVMNPHENTADRIDSQDKSTAKDQSSVSAEKDSVKKQPLPAQEQAGKNKPDHSDHKPVPDKNISDENKPSKSNGAVVKNALLTNKQSASRPQSANPKEIIINPKRDLVPIEETPAAVEKKLNRRNTKKRVEKMIDTTAEDKNNEPHQMSNAQYITDICRSVKANDLVMINRILTIGFGSEGAKEIYSQFKSDETFRNDMMQLYLPTKQERLYSLIVTALRFNKHDENAANEICSIISQKRSSNLQDVYHSFIKRMPGSMQQRQAIYKTIKPYLAVIQNL